MHWCFASKQLGGNANLETCGWGNANFSVFRYQYVGIPNAKFRIGGLKSIFHGDPTQPLFHWLALGFCFGGNTNFMFRVGGNANFSVFRYQHVGIGIAKLWCWVSKPTQGPKANGFASQWNIDVKNQSNYI